jgi:hypothetical protein
VDSDPEATNLREMAGALRAVSGEPLTGAVTSAAASRRLMPSTSYRALGAGVGTGLVSGTSPFASPSHSPDHVPRTLSRQSSFTKHHGALEEGGGGSGSGGGGGGGAGPDYTDAELEAMCTPRSFLGRQNSFLIHSATALGAGRGLQGPSAASVAPVPRAGHQHPPPTSGACSRTTHTPHTHKPTHPHTHIHTQPTCGDDSTVVLLWSRARGGGRCVCQWVVARGSPLGCWLLSWAVGVGAVAPTILLPFSPPPQPCKARFGWPPQSWTAQASWPRFKSVD